VSRRRRAARGRFFRALGPVAEVRRTEPVSEVLARRVEPALEDMTVLQLRALALEQSVVLGMGRRTKAAIIEALR
jgi:hypothetical protein